MNEVEQITEHELAKNTDQVLERVGAGKRIEVTRNGEPVAILSPPYILLAKAATEAGLPLTMPGVD